MKHLLLSLLLALPLAVQAQSSNAGMWCPPGATWTYGFTWWSEQGTVTVRYARDTVVAGQPAQVLTRQLTTVFFPGPTPGANRYLSPIITRTVANRVEVWANGQFYTLYDFAAPPGSTWATPLVIPWGTCPPAMGIVQIVVDSVGTRMLGGQVLRWFRPRVVNPGVNTRGYWSGRVYEQLGSLQYMQPQSTACPATDPGDMGPFQSFRAIGWPTIGYNASTGTLLRSTQARAEAAGFIVYPNPSAGASSLTVALPPGTNPASQLSLLDLAGRVVRRQPALSGQVLNVRGLTAGIYTLRLDTPGAASLVRRVVLE